MYSRTVTQYEELPKKVEETSAEPTPIPKEEKIEQSVIWGNVICIGILHVTALYGVIFRCYEAMAYTWIYQVAYLYSSGVGITAGAHRLWAHRSYSAKLPLRILLGVLYCMGGQTHMYKWIRDHRTHHKFTETAADPHDANRGFFFSHVGWLMTRRHPAVKKYGSKIDMSDIAADPVIRWVDWHYNTLMCTVCFVIPTLVPVYGWGEKWDVAGLVVMVRYVFVLNATFCVNSLAHMSGNKPYNKSFKAVENAGVAIVALGEGWHNYHHAFPWDYKAAELPGYMLNVSTAFIDLMAWLGLAYNLKTPSKDVVKKVSLNKGDGTRSRYGNDYHKLQKRAH